MVDVVQLAVMLLTIFTGLLSLLSFVFGKIAQSRGIACAELLSDFRYGAETTIGLAGIYVVLGWLQGGTCGA